MEQIQSRLQARVVNGSIECHDYTDDVIVLFVIKSIVTSLYKIII